MPFDATIILYGLGGDILLKFKVDIIDLLKENGYNTTRIRREKLIGEKTMQDMKAGIVPGIKTLDTLCRILEMQPGNLIKYESGDITKKSDIDA